MHKQDGGDAIVGALDTFKQELSTMRFSAASTDKMSNNAGFKASNDALIVAGLMDELVELFGKSWQSERNKQQVLKSRFKVDVPLLVLTPCSWKSAFLSRQPVGVLGTICLAAIIGLSANVVIAMAVLGVEHAWGPAGVAHVCIIAAGSTSIMSCFCMSSAHDFRLPGLLLALKYYGPAVVTCAAVAFGIFSLIIVVEPEWHHKRAQTWVLYILAFIICVWCKVADGFAVWSSPVRQADIKSQARQLPSFCKRLFKGFKVGFTVAVIMEVVLGYIQVCVNLRVIVSAASPPKSAVIVIFANLLKQGLMFIVASLYLPWMKANFTASDSATFAFNALLTFGTRLLVTAVSSPTAILVTSMLSSCLDLGVSRAVVHLSYRKVCRLEVAVDAIKEYETGFNPLAHDSDQDEALADARRRLYQARRRLSTEVITLMNDLLVEFYCTASAAICGIIFRRSSVVTLLETELRLEQLPIYITVQYIPELLDAWLIIVYLSHLGVGWSQLASNILENPRILAGKLSLLMQCLFMTLCVAIGRD